MSIVNKVAIELIPKQEVRKSLLVNIFFYLSLILLLIVVFLFLIFIYWDRKTSQAIEGVDSQIANLRTEEIQKMEKTVLDYQKKINVFGQLLDSHKYPLTFFDYLESYTHPRVYFSNFSLDAAGLKVLVSGKAESFTALGQQVLVLQAAELFKDVKLSSIGMAEEGGADFSIDFSIDSSIFKPLKEE